MGEYHYGYKFYGLTETLNHIYALNIIYAFIKFKYT